MMFYKLRYLLAPFQTADLRACPLRALVLYLVFTVGPLVVLTRPLFCALNNLSCNATPGALWDLLLLAEGPQ